jgi:hypothetical protein
MSEKGKRVGVFNLKFKQPDGTNKRVDFGAMFSTQWDGNYGCSLTLPTGEEDENGYPVRAKVVALKTAPCPGHPEGIKMEVDEAFVNYVQFEHMEPKPPREN